MQKFKYALTLPYGFSFDEDDPKDKRLAAGSTAALAQLSLSSAGLDDVPHAAEMLPGMGGTKIHLNRKLNQKQIAIVRAFWRGAECSGGLDRT